MQQNNLVTIEGRNAVLETLKTDRNIKKLIIENTAKGDKIAEIENLAHQKSILIEYKDRFLLNKQSVTKTHEGVIALAGRKEFLSFKQFQNTISNKENVCVLILRGLMHDQNLGAIVRTAASSGVCAIALTKEKKDFFINSQVERVSEGATNYITFIKESFFSLLKNLDKEGYKIIALENTGTVNYFDEDYTGKIAIILGNESETLGERNYGNIVKIPMVAKISSLNVSVSAGIVLYERLKQIIKNGKTI